MGLSSLCQIGSDVNEHPNTVREDDVSCDMNKTVNKKCDSCLSRRFEKWIGSEVHQALRDLRLSVREGARKRGNLHLNNSPLKFGII